MNRNCHGLNISAWEQTCQQAVYHDLATNACRDGNRCDKQLSSLISSGVQGEPAAPLDGRETHRE